MDKLEAEEEAVHPLGVELDVDFGDVHGEGHRKVGHEDAKYNVEAIGDV